MADKRGTTDAIKRRELREAICRHEEYIHPPKYDGAPTVKKCCRCGRETQVKG